VQQRLTNAAILLFIKNLQRFFISSEIKCAHFHGTTITKPIPSYHVFKGDVFQLVNQAVDFLLSRIDVSDGTREESIQVPIQYELPPAAVTEAIVIAVAHRDYTNNGSIQVMLIKDCVEIWNPGSLPYGLTTATLRKPHSSIPANPLLAEPMYLGGFIERMGTGSGDIIRLCK
jgi:predicted HTH transcriptional regulator